MAKVGHADGNGIAAFELTHSPAQVNWLGLIASGNLALQSFM